MAPKTFPNRQKINQKGKKKRRQKLIDFLIGFLNIFFYFLQIFVRFLWILTSAKWHHYGAKRTFVTFSYFVSGVALKCILAPKIVILGAQKPSKTDQKPIKNQSKRTSKTRCKLGWGLDGSWDEFLSILAPSWRPSWGQVGTNFGKIKVPRRCQKSDAKNSCKESQGSAARVGAGP